MTQIETNSGVKLGLLGKSLPYTLSPLIHEMLMERLHIEGSYSKYEMDEDGAAHILNFMKKNHIMGMNVTMPYKEAMYMLVDVAGLNARGIMAVNTVLLIDGVLFGYNTDCIGAVDMFAKSNISLSSKKIVILGSGGAARAMVYAFRLEGASRITAASRNPGALKRLRENFSYVDTCSLEEIPDGDIIINATPVGMYPNTDESIVDRDVLRRFDIAADLVYNPSATAFLRAAKREGLTTVSGLRMLTNQAAASQEIWFNRHISSDITDSIYEELCERLEHTL